MAEGVIVVIHLKEEADDADIREHLKQRCNHLAEEFPETSHYEIHLEPNAEEIAARGHVTGRNTNIAAHATSSDLRQAGERVIDKLERELRREHDKRIFTLRRKARAKRSS
jgi:ribosomal subunit interface protein